jgi:hypothetical protein
MKADVTYIDAIEQNVTDIVGNLDDNHGEHAERDLRLLKPLAELHQQVAEELEECAVHIVLRISRMRDVVAVRPAFQRVSIVLHGPCIVHEQGRSRHS